jgi:peptidoglycan L-alanyl-D-glutamate endopeptidase CwlK
LWSNHYAADRDISKRLAKGCCVSIILGSRSLSRLEGVHPDLVRVVKKAAALSDLDFTVLEGLRTLDRQRKLLAQGASKTLNSRHITGHAVDLAPLIDGKVSWDWPLYHRLAKIIKAAAVDENVPITWGGDWRTFKDGPHWELPWKSYPKGK